MRRLALIPGTILMFLGGCVLLDTYDYSGYEDGAGGTPDTSSSSGSTSTTAASSSTGGGGGAAGAGGGPGCTQELCNNGIDDDCVNGDCSVTTVTNYRFGDIKHQAIKAMALASNGDVVIGGNFGGALAFGGMPLNNGTMDLWPYVARIRQNGNAVAVYPGTTKGVCTGVAVKEPDIFAVKLTFGSPDPTIKTTHIEKSGGWSKMLGGDAENGAPSITGGGGWLHMAASVKGMVDTFACPTLPPFTTGTVDSLVMQVDPVDGDCLWGVKIAESNVVSIAASTDIVAIGGSYKGSNIGLPGTKPPNTGTAAFLAVYDLKALHNLIGSDFLATEGPPDGIVGFTTMTIGSSGNIFAAGTFKGTLTAKGETLKSTNNGGDIDLIVANYEPTANLLWIKRFGGMGLQAPNSIVAQGTNVFISGTTEASMAIVPNTDSGPLCNTGKCMFLLKLDAATGNTLWGRAFGSEEPPVNDATALIAADTANLWLGGGWSSPIDFGTGNEPSGGAQDVVLAWFTALP